MRHCTGDTLIFIDSSVLVAYFVKDDVNHERAEEIIEQIAGGKFESAFVSDYVFDETITATLVRSKSLKDAVSAGMHIKNTIEILTVGNELFNESWDLFRSQKGTALSFTDCTILSIMDKKNIRYLATFDGEFKNVASINVVN